MQNQTFCYTNLYKLLPAIDKIKAPSYQDEIVNSSLNLINNNLNDPLFLKKIKYKNKDIFITDQAHKKIICKKLSANIIKTSKIKLQNRNFITANIKSLIEEGNPYRIYRFDIKDFFESFNQTQILQCVKNIEKLLPINIKILEQILHHHKKLAGQGVPRGLSISTCLSELMMNDFDKFISSHPEVFYYSRYVDDMLIITSGREEEKAIIKSIKDNLPEGLILNNKKTYIADGTKLNKKKSQTTYPPEEFEYLGYNYKFWHIQEPPDTSYRSRDIEVTIANSKIKKIKKRICRSFISFSKNRDFPLLLDRIKFLTNNFSIYDLEAARKKNIGIYYNYPLLTQPSKSLKELDRFLKNAILSKTGKIFSQSAPHLNSNMKKKLLGQSFERGHIEKKYINFSRERISEIKSCWEH